VVFVFLLGLGFFGFLFLCFFLIFLIFCFFGLKLYVCFFFFFFFLLDFYITSSVPIRDECSVLVLRQKRTTFI